MFFILPAIRRICFTSIAVCVIGLYMGITDRFDQMIAVMAGGGAITAALTGAIWYFFDE